MIKPVRPLLKHIVLNFNNEFRYLKMSRQLLAEDRCPGNRVPSSGSFSSGSPVFRQKPGTQFFSFRKTHHRLESRPCRLGFAQLIPLVAGRTTPKQQYTESYGYNQVPKGHRFCESPRLLGFCDARGRLGWLPRSSIRRWETTSARRACNCREL